MKKSSSKKGFSLIELIVVIAVIAAIAAVIVPSITNFSDEAKVTADKRNVQLWNQTYQEAVAAGASTDGGATAMGGVSSFISGTNVKNIDVYAKVGNKNVNFNAASFSLSSKGTIADGTTGITFTPPNGL